VVEYWAYKSLLKPFWLQNVTMPLIFGMNFETNEITKNGHETWQMECKETQKGRVFAKRCKVIRLHLVGMLSVK
jgi:hypothetical protein